MKLYYFFPVLLFLACNYHPRNESDESKDVPMESPIADTTFAPPAESHPNAVQSGSIDMDARIYFYFRFKVEKATSQEFNGIYPDGHFTNYKTVYYVSDIKDYGFFGFTPEIKRRMMDRFEDQVKLSLPSPFPYQILERDCRMFDGYIKASDSLRAEINTEKVYD